MTTFTACAVCPAPVSCDIRSACDRQPIVELQVENAALKLRVAQLQDELANANGALCASRELVRQLSTTVDRQESARAYATTKAFHAQQSRGVSIPAAELAVTEQEEEAFKAIAPRTSAEIRIDDLEQRMERAENAFLLQLGRINSAHDRLDALRAAL